MEQMRKIKKIIFNKKSNLFFHLRPNERFFNFQIFKFRELKLFLRHVFFILLYSLSFSYFFCTFCVIFLIVERLSFQFTWNNDILYKTSRFWRVFVTFLADFSTLFIDLFFLCFFTELFSWLLAWFIQLRVTFGYFFSSPKWLF